MRKASFVERFRFSYTYALLHDAGRSLARRLRRNSSPAAAEPLLKLHERQRGTVTQGRLRSASFH